MLDRFFSNLAFDRETADIRTSDGFSIKVRPNDLIGRHLYLTGQFDRSIVEVLLRLAKPGDTLLDIGANIGYVSACFLANVPDSNVVAVEPQPDVLQLLRSNLAQFGSSRHQVVAAAVSNETRGGWMQPRPGNPGAGTLIESKAPDSISVELWSGARLFSAVKIKKLDLVKIDVEGHEEEVIDTCTTSFEKLRPRAILFEGTPTGRIGSILRGLGYDLFGIKKRLTRLDLVPTSRSSDGAFHDCVAIRR